MTRALCSRVLLVAWVVIVGGVLLVLFTSIVNDTICTRSARRCTVISSVSLKIAKIAAAIFTSRNDLFRGALSSNIACGKLIAGCGRCKFVAVSTATIGVGNRSCCDNVIGASAGNGCIEGIVVTIGGGCGVSGASPCGLDVFNDGATCASYSSLHDSSAQNALVAACCLRDRRSKRCRVSVSSSCRCINFYEGNSAKCLCVSCVGVI